MFSSPSFLSKALLIVLPSIIALSSIAQSVELKPIRKISERSTPEQYEKSKNKKHVNILVKELRESQVFLKQRLEHYQEKKLDIHFAQSKYGRFFPNPKSFILASQDKFRKISVDYPDLMKMLIADTKSFDQKYLNQESVDLVNNILSFQAEFNNRYKSLDIKTQLKLNRIATDLPNLMFKDFSAFLKKDRVQLRELCLSQTRDIVYFKKLITDKKI